MSGRGVPSAAYSAMVAAIHQGRANAVHDLVEAQHEIVAAARAVVGTCAWSLDGRDHPDIAETKSALFHARTLLEGVLEELDSVHIIAALAEDAKAWQTTDAD